MSSVELEEGNERALSDSQLASKNSESAMEKLQNEKEKSQGGPKDPSMAERIPIDLSTHEEQTSVDLSQNNSETSSSPSEAQQHSSLRDDGPNSSSSPIPSGDSIPTMPNGIQSLRQHRSQTLSSRSTNGTRTPTHVSSMVFVVSALEHIGASKEARKRRPLGDAVQNALTAIKREEDPLDPEVIFEPLRLATETGNAPIITAALDCIGKLISYSYFSLSSNTTDSSAPAEQEQSPPLVERAIETICDCFQDESTPAEIQLQIVKSLLAAVLNDKFVVHGSGLLKAIRQVYNIFLLSRSSPNQQVAQGTLSQMVGTVFERVAARLAMKETRLNMARLAPEKGTANGSQADISRSNLGTEATESDGGPELDGSSETVSISASDRPVRKDPGEKLTLQSFENSKSFDDAKIGDNAPTMVTRTKSALNPLRTASGQQITLVNGDDDQSGQDGSEEDEEDEIFVKDAYLVFRSMCRLSIKQLDMAQQQDIKSSNMRSKLMSLAIIRTLLNNNMAVFTSPLITIRSSTSNEPTSFGQAINQYLRLSLSKNGASSVRQVFECCCEIFWLMLKDMRVMLKVLIPLPKINKHPS